MPPHCCAWKSVIHMDFWTSWLEGQRNSTQQDRLQSFLLLLELTYCAQPLDHFWSCLSIGAPGWASVAHTQRHNDRKNRWRPDYSNTAEAHLCFPLSRCEWLGAMSGCSWCSPALLVLRLYVQIASANSWTGWHCWQKSSACSQR